MEVKEERLDWYWSPTKEFLFNNGMYAKDFA